MSERPVRISTTTNTADELVGVIPDKMYFRIGEVATIVGVKPYVLRYWETEFPSLKPHKSRTRQRMYRRREVELLLKIKHLLYDRKYTIAGARQLLKSRGDLNEAPDNAVATEAPLASETAPTNAQAVVVPPLARAAAPVHVAAPSPAPVTTSLPTVAPPVVTEPVRPLAVAGKQGNQLALNLKLTGPARDDLRRGLEDLLHLCDESEHNEIDPLLTTRSTEVAESGALPAAEVSDVG
jgi:DNA-binding transcriptional MerR regulator